MDVMRTSKFRNLELLGCFFFFSSRRRHTRLQGDWSSDVCSSDLLPGVRIHAEPSMGTTGIALSVAKTEEIYQREHELAGRGGFVLEPLEADAVPASLCGHGGGFPGPSLRPDPPRGEPGDNHLQEPAQSGRAPI